MIFKDNLNVINYIYFTVKFKQVIFIKQFLTEFEIYK